MVLRLVVAAVRSSDALVTAASAAANCSAEGFGFAVSKGVGDSVFCAPGTAGSALSRAEPGTTASGALAVAGAEGPSGSVVSGTSLVDGVEGWEGLG